MLLSDAIRYALDTEGVAILPPMDVFDSISVVQEAKKYTQTVQFLTLGTIKALVVNCQ